MTASIPTLEQQPDATTALPRRRTPFLVLYGIFALIAVIVGVVVGTTRHRGETLATAVPTEQAVLATVQPGIPTPTPLATTPTPAPTAPPPTAVAPTAIPPTDRPAVQSAPVVNQRPADPPGNSHGKAKGKEKGKGD